MNQNAHRQSHTRHIWRRARLMHWLGRLAMLLLFCVLAIAVLLHRIFLGPSAAACNNLTMTMLQTSALKFVPYLYMSSETVDRIVSQNTLIEPEGETDTSMISINGQKEVNAQEAIELVHIKGRTYKGYLLIVHDPSRVFVGVTDSKFSTVGKTLEQIIEQYDAIGGVNANGFEDDKGMGDGGIPLGLVVSEGQLLHRANYMYASAGFDQNNILHVGRFTDQEVTQLGLRDAVSFGPVLIVNGVAANSVSSTTGLNPRTAIGQRADGAVLLLVLDGRQTDSIGATYQDVIDVMLSYGAVNACNLDGGTSSAMYYQGERVNGIPAITGTRSIPCAILIRGENTYDE